MFLMATSMGKDRKDAENPGYAKILQQNDIKNTA